MRHCGQPRIVLVSVQYFILRKYFAHKAGLGIVKQFHPLGRVCVQEDHSGRRYSDAFQMRRHRVSYEPARGVPEQYEGEAVLRSTQVYSLNSGQSFDGSRQGLPTGKSGYGESRHLANSAAYSGETGVFMCARPASERSDTNQSRHRSAIGDQHWFRHILKVCLIRECGPEPRETLKKIHDLAHIAVAEGLLKHAAERRRWCCAGGCNV